MPELSARHCWPVFAILIHPVNSDLHFVTCQSYLPDTVFAILTHPVNFDLYCVTCQSYLLDTAGQFLPSLFIWSTGHGSDLHCVTCQSYLPGTAGQFLPS